MEVSWNRGTPESSILVGFPITNHPFGVSPFMEPPICADSLYLYIMDLWNDTLYCSFWKITSETGNWYGNLRVVAWWAMIEIKGGLPTAGIYTKGGWWYAPGEWRRDTSHGHRKCWGYLGFELLQMAKTIHVTGWLRGISPIWRMIPLFCQPGWQPWLASPISGLSNKMGYHYC